jgi:RNA polymerase sigma-70 factor (ECF subfamily)
MLPKDQSLTMVERLYRARADDLLRYLRRRFLNEADARDVAQEAFLRFWRLQDSERLRSPEAYLFRIAGNLLYERRLREAGERQGQPVGEPPVDEYTPFELAVAAEEETLLRETVRTLPVLWRSILTLHLRDGLTFAQIASQTGINISLAKKHYYKAVMACRERLTGLNAGPGQR